MIVISPSDTWLKEALADCTKSFSVASPYVGAYLRDAVSKLDEEITMTLLTRTLLTDFASSASNLEAAHSLAQRAQGVLSLSSLHAKVFVIDDRRALVTSANATFSGMHRNRECGVEIRMRRDIKHLRDLIESGFGTTPRPQLWTADDLAELREPVEALRSALPRVATLREAAIEAPPRVQLQRRQFDRFLENLSGWARLTMEGIARIPSDTFTMDQVLAACAALAAARYPDNRHVREKLRQQMQRLRDLGLVAFLGNGRYERLVRRTK
jgi:hypothetical protein